MKRLWMCLGLFMALAGARANAQQNVETWQGTLRAGHDLRLVLQVSKTDAGVTGRLYSIDQGPGGMGTTTLSMDGGVLKFTILGMDCSYEGKLSPDGKSAAGIWKQGGHDTPLVLEHVNADAAWEIPKTTTALSLMDPGLTPGYEVATINPSNPDEQRRGFNLRGQHIVVSNMSAQDLILLAYNLHAKQLTGGPSWLAENNYDMEILPDHDGLPSLEQAMGIMRKLLADRFALKFHDETKDMPAYVLTVARAGSKLMKSGADPKSPPGMGGPPGRYMMRIRKHGGVRRTDARDNGPARDRPDGPEGPLRFKAELDARPIPVWRKDPTAKPCRQRTKCRSLSAPVYGDSGATWIEAGCNEGAGQDNGDRKHRQAVPELADSNPVTAAIKSRLNLACQASADPRLVPTNAALVSSIPLPEVRIPRSPPNVEKPRILKQKGIAGLLCHFIVLSENQTAPGNLVLAVHIRHQTGRQGTHIRQLTNRVNLRRIIHPQLSHHLLRQRRIGRVHLFNPYLGQSLHAQLPCRRVGEIHNPVHRHRAAIVYPENG